MLAESEKWHQVSLRLAGDALPCERVSELLGLPATSIHPKGAEYVPGHPRSARYRTNHWGHSFTVDATVPFEEQLSEAVTRLEAVRERLFDVLSISGVDGSLFLGFASGNGQGGCTISADLTSRIGALRLDVVLDLYPPDVDERSAAPARPGPHESERPDLSPRK